MPGLRKYGVRCLAGILLAAFCITPARGVDGVYGEFRGRDQTWVIGNPLIQAAFQLTPDGRFRYRWLYDALNVRVWSNSNTDPGSPINLTINGAALDAGAAYSLSSYSFEEIEAPAPGMKFRITFSTDAVPGEVEFEAEVYANQPVLRYRTLYENTSPWTSYVTQADMLSWNFRDSGETYRDFFVGQWRWGRANFEPHETELSTNDGPATMFTGADADHAAWRAIRDSHDFGLAAAWEFDGRTSAYAEHRRDSRILKLDAEVIDLNHRVAPGEVFRVPDAFIEVFRGDWDEAGYRTQRFAENVLAVRVPEPEKFPYAMFDTWGYGQAINEETAMQAARQAAEAGVEVFTLDLGWARNIGDWQPDPEKFPNGLKPLSDYVHSLGMKFGLHIPFLEASPDSVVMKQHPDWKAVNPERDGAYFGAVSLCPSHRPARDWIISELIRVIQEYGVDWVTQDGDNMVKYCDATDHTHAVGDSNYSNAIDGLDEILSAVQSATPGVLWENCEDGGSMQTFHMIQRYVTSAITDSVDALTTRQGVYGATYPFPPRYTDRYMDDPPSDTYHTRSYLFGGPFIIMNRITDWSRTTLDFMKREIELYKFVRTTIRDAKIYHLTEPPDGTQNDAMEAYDAQQDRSFIFVYGAEPRATIDYIRPRGLTANAQYGVNFLEVQHSYVATGAEIMNSGIPVIMRPTMAEVVAITRR